VKRPSEREWADLFAGRVAPERRIAMLALADAQPDVAEIRDRVERVTRALERIRTDPGPELPWDHIGARVHWEVSLARRKPIARQRRVPFAIAGAFGVAVVAVAALWQLRVLAPHERSRPVRHASVPAPAAPAVAPEPVAVRPLAALLTLVQGEVLRDGVAIEAGDFDRPIEAGARLVTREGRVAVQFEAGGAFELGPRSTLVVRSLDGGRIALAVDGQLDVEVSHREAGQAFVVTTDLGDVSVRGTRFRVDHRQGALDVVCTRGEVAFRSPSASEDAVPSGRRLHVGAGEVVSVTDVPAAELDAIDASLDIPMVASWNDATATARGTGFVGVSEPGEGALAINGIEVGASPVWLRVGPGRHHVATHEDGVSRGGWVELGAGSRHALSRAEIRGPQARPDRGADRRRLQLARAFEDAGAGAHCLRGLRKRGLASGAFLDLDIGINRDGSQRYLNVSATDLPPAVRTCVIDVVDHLELGAGPAVRLRHRLSF